MSTVMVVVIVITRKRNVWERRMRKRKRRRAVVVVFLRGGDLVKYEDLLLPLFLLPFYSRSLAGNAVATAFLPHL